MGKTDHQKLQKTVTQQIAESGGISVTFDCGCDGSGVSFSGWKDEGEHRWKPAKAHLERELTQKLNLSDVGNHKLDGTGWIEVNDDRVELTYSLADKTRSGFSDAELLLPAPDAENVPLVSKESIAGFDFEVTLTISASDTPQYWHSECGFKMTPRVTGEAKQQLVQMLAPVIQPYFEQLTASQFSRREEEIVLRSLDFNGFFWHETGQMYYAIKFGRERIVRTVKSKKLELFDSTTLPAE